MTASSLQETIEAKRAFEKVAATYYVKVRHYHTDNGHFACKCFKDEVAACD